MSAKFPTSLIIRGERWTVEYVKKIRKRDWSGKKHVRVHRKGSSYIAGLCLYLKRHIMILEHAAPASKRRILLHEAKHAYDEDAPMGLDPGLVEGLCDRFAGDVVDLLRWNDMSWAKCSK